MTGLRRDLLRRPRQTVPESRPPLYGVVESGAARLMRMRTSLELLIEKAGGVLGAVTATKSARWTSSR